jgi:hypothetical protein
MRKTPIWYMKLPQICTLVINLQIVNSRSPSCPTQAFWSLRRLLTFFLVNCPLNFWFFLPVGPPSNCQLGINAACVHVGTCTDDMREFRRWSHDIYLGCVWEGSTPPISSGAAEAIPNTQNPPNRWSGARYRASSFCRSEGTGASPASLRLRRLPNRYRTRDMVYYLQMPSD